MGLKELGEKERACHRAGKLGANAVSSPKQLEKRCMTREPESQNPEQNFTPAPKKKRSLSPERASLPEKFH